MHSILAFITVVFAALAAHPVETAAGAYIALSIVNGLLPSTVITGPVGAVLHIGLDRLAVLVRRDARGTLKLPFVASALVLVADSLIEVVDPRPARTADTYARTLGPDADDAARELTEGLVRGQVQVPEAIAPTHFAAAAAFEAAGAAAREVPSSAGSRAGERGRASLGALLGLVVVAVVACGCGGGAAATLTAAADTASSVVLVARKVRAALCAEQLDPYLGPVRERVVVVHDVALDAGSADGAVDAGAGE